MKSRLVVLLAAALLLGGCMGKLKMKHMYAGELKPQTEVAAVYASTAKGALVLITKVDGVPAFEWKYGNLGPVAVLPGTHSFTVSATIGIDAPKGEPPPEGAALFELVPENLAVLASTYSATVPGTVEAGKAYEIRYGLTADKRHVLYFIGMGAEALTKYNKHVDAKPFQPTALRSPQ
jgi:hypothetical protein